MKAKPDTDQFKSNKGLAAFLEGGTADAADKLQQPDGVAQVLAVLPVANTKVHREQKVFRLPLDIINALKRESYELSVQKGCRVTETELVEQAIRAFLEI